MRTHIENGTDGRVGEGRGGSRLALEARNAIRIVLNGIQPGEGKPGPSMPGFDGAFSETQLTALLRYLHAHYSGGTGWTDLETQLRDIRRARER